MDDNSIIFIVKAKHHYTDICYTLSKNNISCPVYYSETPEGCLQIAKEQVIMGTKVIIANKFLCDLFQEHLTVSTTGLRRSSYPFISTVIEILNYQEKVAFLARDGGYAFGSGAVESQLVFPDKVYTYLFEDRKDCKKILQNIKDDGFNTVICPHWVGDMAKDIGLNYRFLSLMEKDILEAIHYAKFQLRVYEQRARSNMLISKILDMTSEGVVAINPHGIILDINQMACQILHLNRRDVLEKHFSQTYLKEFNLESYITNNEETRGEIVMIGDEMLIYNIKHLVVNGESSAAILTFNSARQVQDSEQRIRLSKLESGNTATKTFQSIIGSSKEITNVINVAKKYAAVDSTVFISAPSGCGKEIFAQSIHNESTRSKYPFVVINCASMPENVLESLLFGYAPGTFTGANKDGKVGLFELANQGTVFLDEVSEMPLSMQGRFLRVIQEKEVTPIGGNYSIPVEFRLLVATNRDLWNMVKNGEFREDLYHRIHVLVLEIPPLSERRDDIKSLAKYFIYNRSKELRLNVSGINNDALDLLSQLTLSGNVRQLNNILERAMVLCNSDLINKSDILNSLPSNLRNNLNQGLYTTIDSDYDELSNKKLNYRREIVKEALSKSNGNRAMAASLLGISTTTLWRRMKELNIV